MKIKPTMVGFSGEYGSKLSLVLIKTRNAPIPTMKIRHESESSAVNKAHTTAFWIESRL